MKSAHPDSGCPSLGCGQAANDVSFDARNMPGTHLRSVLATLVGAPMRLHRFRNLHTAVLEDAISAYDCSRPCGKDS